ncbi:unnamed protein product, partial [marine sediment metagenome]
TPVMDLAIPNGTAGQAGPLLCGIEIIAEGW